MVSKTTKMFSKLLTDTDIKKRLAIPAKSLPSLPPFNGSHAVIIHLLCGTSTWPILCTIRRKGYKKPVFSGGLWRNFVVSNNVNVGDKITMCKVQYEDGSSHYLVELEKSAASNQYGALPSPALSFNHDADANALPNSGNEVEHLAKTPDDAPIKQKGVIRIMELSNGATDTLVDDDHVINKPSVKIFGTNLSDEVTEMKWFMAKEEINFFGIDEGGAIAMAMTYGSGTSDDCGEACCNIITHHQSEVSLDLVLRQPNPL
uniref:TF-B3 domain-containing protein n=2 Tax=Gossypium raimondii TaxID=29730 RepID=A0A0D2VZJ8_GOSRA|nr:hypothetical protein B456_012G167600 [Gossypium raimondii]